jgi:hypothetical protein
LQHRTVARRLLVGVMVGVVGVVMAAAAAAAAVVAGG